MKIIVFGAGNRAKELVSLYLKEVFEKVEIIGYVDNNEQKWNTEFLGKRVYAPTDIKDLEYDKIIICLWDEFYAEVYKQLVFDLKIPTEKIENAYYLLKQMKNEIACKKVQTRMPKVYDCFIFFNELELLELRLELLNQYVDYFVLVEMNKTFNGKEKICYFAENRDRFKKYEDKIIYICPEEVPTYIDGNREELGYYLDYPMIKFQRNCILRGLAECEPDDIILSSDFDEFPNPKIIEELRNSYGKNLRSSYVNLFESSALLFEQDFFYYNFNCRQRIKWYGTVAVKYKNLITPQFLRDCYNMIPCIKEGGWHFSYFGGTERIKTKITSINDGIDVAVENIEKRVKERKDLMARKYFGSDNMEYIGDLSQIGLPELEMLEAFVKKYPYLCEKEFVERL